MEQHPKSDERVMDDIGEAFDGADADATADTDARADADEREPDIPRSGQTPPDELARVREEADAKIGSGGGSGMSGAESGYGVTGESSGLDSTERSDLSDEGLNLDDDPADRDVADR